MEPVVWGEKATESEQGCGPAGQEEPLGRVKLLLAGTGVRVMASPMG